MPSLEKKIAVITGSTSGIGRGIAEHFASLGATVVIHGLDERHARNVAAELQGAGRDALAIHGDLREVDVCRRGIRFAIQTRGGGSIVNIGSINAYVGAPKLGPYAVSKGGLMTMTKNAATALNRYRIRVNQLNVGWTLTEGEEQVQRKNREGREWLEDALATRPFGRLLRPQDIAYAAAYFASDESALITGAV